MLFQQLSEKLTLKISQITKKLGYSWFILLQGYYDSEKLFPEKNSDCLELYNLILFDTSLIEPDSYSKHNSQTSTPANCEADRKTGYLNGQTACQICISRMFLCQKLNTNALNNRKKIARCKPLGSLVQNKYIQAKKEIARQLSSLAHSLHTLFLYYLIERGNEGLGVRTHLTSPYTNKGTNGN